MSSYQIPNINNKPPQLIDGGFYCDILFDPDDSAPNYIGLNLQQPALTSTKDWKIYKLTYSGLNVTRYQVAYGSWDNRASLF